MPTGGKVLDLGCGTGISTRRLAAAYPHADAVEGVDLSPHFLQVGRRLLELGRAASSADSADSGKHDSDQAADGGDDAWQWVNARDGYTDPRVMLRYGLAEATGLPDSSVDAVNVGLVVHELPPEATRAVMREAHRVLKPGG